MSKFSHERRKYLRYDTEVKVYFHVTYDIKTVVKFQLVDREKGRKLSEKYEALSKNVSVEGLCFTSSKKIEKGDALQLEVYLPNQKDPIIMEGEVRWCREEEGSPKGKSQYDAGIKILSVNGEFVPASIYQDNAYQVTWSILLESVLGNFSVFASKEKKI